MTGPRPALTARLEPRTGTVRRMKSRPLLVTLSLAAVVAAGCTDGAGSEDKAGGSEPVVLKMANTGSNLPFTPALGYFVNRVNELSGGDLRIDMVYQWGNFSADAEQQVVLDVKAGKADLTWAGTRVFDTLGVDSFRALQAPMLIDSYAVQDAVTKSDIPGQMLRGLDRIGVVGLAVVPSSLPKLIAVNKPLLGPQDWRGITFQAYRSNVVAQAIRALGAQPTDTLGGLAAGLVDGSIQGFAKSLLTYQLNDTERLAPYVTANVNLWPGTGVLLANPGRLSRLSGEQRAWLFQAAGDAAARSTSLVEHEDQIVADVCQAGTRFAKASKADLAALRQALTLVYTSLEQDPQTKAFIARIEALKASTPADPPLTIPPGCTGSASGSSTPNDPIAGTWRTGHLTETQIVRAFIAGGGSEKEGHAFFAQLGTGATRYAVITVTFTDGDFEEYESGDGGPSVHGDQGTYEISYDNRLTLSFGGSACTSGLRYEVSGDNLRLYVVKQCALSRWDNALYETYPFTKSS